ncbi:MAG: hypothetical protein HN742_21345 [Lentisphaerae bacterium]|jgi:hypothetical protein|nr:hypothetical protein [Lentisphaerota bacterium]MBT4820422.1 hypothetical protein [Lentisphaerota bacterium]MBT5613120.1 hypothetical protein [Lentisphaerota bacterium]MBT7061987.1 hypothetical protein [Lentisphaerota bacterium]MBT7844437.1 hypothetical protein [Lentisphaerota bacterium]
MDSTKRTNSTCRESGAALILVLGVLSVLAVLGTAVPALMSVETAWARADARRLQAFYAARAGIEHVLVTVSAEVEKGGKRSGDMACQLTSDCHYQIWWGGIGPEAEAAGETGDPRDQLAALRGTARALAAYQGDAGRASEWLGVCAEGRALRGKGAFTRERIMALLERTEGRWQVIYWNEGRGR